MSESRLSGRDLTAALVVVVLWGLNFVVMKFGLRDFSPFQLGAARYLLATLPLIFFIRPPALPWRWVLLFGLLVGVGQFGFLFSALKVGMTASLASVLMQTQVFFTALFGYVLLREGISRQLVVGLILAALGLICFAMNFVMQDATGTSDLRPIVAVTAMGFALTLCGAASWSLANIVTRKAQQLNSDYDAMAFVVWSSAVPIIPFIALSCLLDADASRWLSVAAWAKVSWTGWLAVVYLGWVATIGGYVLWTGLLKRHPANRVAPFALAVPVLGLAAGMMFLGEMITAWQWAGIALIGCALASVMFGGRWLNRR
jgi:O-acetylserine/cysteine efflux transporter